MQTKKLLSLFTAVTMAASAFSAFVFPASAEDTQLAPSFDTYVASEDTTDYSTAQELRVLQDSKIALLEFDTSQLDGTVTSASLKFNIASRAWNESRARWESTSITLEAVDTDEALDNTIQLSDYSEMTKTTLSSSTIWSENDTSTPSDGVAPYHERTFNVTNAVSADEDGIIVFAIKTGTGREQAIASSEDTTYAPTLTVTTSEAEAYTVTVNNKVGDTTIATYSVDNCLEGSQYVATNAQTGYKVYDGKTYVMEEDAVTTLDVSSDNLVLDIPFVELDSSVVLYEDFGNVTDTWGFTAGKPDSVVAGDGFLTLTNIGATSGEANEYGYYYSDVKEFDEAITALKTADVTFEWTGATEGGKNRKNAFELRDSNNDVIFGILSQASKGSSDTIGAGVTYQVGAAVTDASTNIPSSGWSTGDSGVYTISLHLDFTGETGIVSGTIKGGVSNADITIPETEITAINLAKIVASDVYSAAPQRLGFFQIASDDEIIIDPEPEKYAVTVAETTNGTVTADKTEAAAGETITLTVTPAENYELDTLSVTAADDTDVPVTNNEFVMPAQAVTVTAAFKAVTIAPTQAPTEAPTQAPTQAPTEAPTQAPTEAPTQAPTEAPTQAPTEAPTEEPIGENEAILTLYEAPAEDTQAVVIISTYDDDGEMLSMSIDDITLSAGETRVRVDAPNGSKVMIWDSLASMTPLADPAIAGDGYVDPTPTTEPTAAPTQEPIDLTAVIDFTNRTLTYESKGNTTVFNVVSADTIAPALAAAGAGDVLQLGSNQNGASKMLGYKASFAKEGEDVVVYSGQATMSFKLELNQVRTDKDAKIELSFADINGTSILPITVGTGNSAYLTVNGVNASNIAYGNYYIVTYTMDFDAQTASVTITDASGNPCLDTGSVAIEAENITQLYRADSDWLYGYVIIDDIKLDATNIGVPKFYTITVNTERYAKLTTDAGDNYFADVNGKLEIPLQTPGTTFDYTISKVGYADITGTVEPLTGDITIDKPMTKTDESVIFIESEFGNENEAYVSPGGNRNDSISLGEITLPDISEISVDFEFAGFGNYSGQQKTWYINTDAGELVGIQINDNGLIAWTGWTGSANHNQSEDAGTFTNSEKIGDAPNGAFTVSFVVDKVNKAITVLYNDSSYSLPYTIEAAAITGLGTGLYRYNGELKTTEIKIVEPDTEFMQLSGDTNFAKVSGKTVTRSYLKSEAVITPGETFTWTVTNADNATDANVTITQEGVLSVTDAAAPGVYTVTCTGTTGKTASLDVTVQDFATVTPTVDGPKTYTVGQEGTYAVTSLVDQYGDDVFELFDAKFASDNTDVITIDETTGVATAVANGDANISITIGNPGKENTVTIPVTVDTYYVTADASGDSTAVDISSIINKGNGTYQVTTTNSGAIVNQTTVNAPAEGTSITVDTTGADTAEVAPIYSATIGQELLVPNDRYNITVSASGRRTDFYVNDQLFINNINQGSDNWTIGRIFDETTVKSVEDVIINEGYAVFNLQDNAGATVNGITFVKAPSAVERQQRIYVLGDSLVAEYYGTAPEGQEAFVRTGWGQVLENYIVDSVGVTNLGNSGVTALGLRDSAFSNVVHSAQPGDIMILESGYNDKNYNTEAEMTEAVTYMVETAYAMGLKTFVVTPNASSHGTGQKPDVNWSGLMRTIASDLGEKTTLIDLAQESYDFLTGLYTTDGTMDWSIVTKYYNNEKDALHSSTNAANCWARIIAQGLYDNGLEDVVDTEYSYTFNDGIADRVIQVKAE